MGRRCRSRGATAALLLVLPVAAACAAVDGEAPTVGASPAAAEVVELRLAFLPNLTHATALVGVEKGFFADALGDDVTLTAMTFNAGPAAVEALFSGAVDAAYLGPSPTVNAFVRSEGRAVRVVSGAASGGVLLVVREGIDSAEELRGATLATPQLGSTQDVALRHWLGEQGLRTDLAGGGDVTIAPQANAQVLDAFAAGAVDGAWVPEPTATRLLGAGATVLVDERDLWPDGRFVTTNLVVHPDFLAEHPEVVRSLLEGHVTATRWLQDDPAEAQQVVADALGGLSGTPLPPDVLAKAWDTIEFTYDPVAASLLAGARHAAEVGTLEAGEPDLDGLYDLSLLNDVLLGRDLPAVAGP